MDSGQTPRERKRMMVEQNRLLNELPLIERRIRLAGLWAAATKMNEVVSAAGYEAAELRTKWNSLEKEPGHE